MSPERALPASTTRPQPRPLTARQGQIVEVAAAVLEAEGPEAVTMRRLGEELGMRAPSLYKHVASKEDVELLLVEAALTQMGAAIHEAIGRPGRRGPVAALLATYRRTALAGPHHYRLATAGRLPRARLVAGLEGWAGEPFFLVTGDAHLAQALWAFAHGMTQLEIDGRFPDDSDLDRTWAVGATTFAADAPARTDDH